MRHSTTGAIFALLVTACSSSDPQDFFSETQDPSGSNSPEMEGTCDVTGTWATFVEVGVEWQSGTIKSGAGTVKQWILHERQMTGDGTTSDTATACGMGAQGVPLGSPWFAIKEFPELGLDSEWTGVEFSKGLFDDGAPRVALDVTVETADPQRAQLGDEFTSATMPFAFGVEGLHRDDWPPIEAMRPLLVDHDGDGRPGLTGTPFSGPVPGEPEGTMFRNPRLGIEQDPARAELLFMAIRTRAALEGELVSCDPPRFDGHVTPPDSLLIETRNVGCRVAGSGEPCTPEQVSFIDSNLPVFEPNGTSCVISIRVPDDATCEDVRNMPEFDCTVR